MNKSLDTYSKLPESMQDYIDNYGFHFSKKACDFAVKQMKRTNNSTGSIEPIEPYTKEKVDEIISNSGITIRKNKLYDYVYVANMVKADYKNSIPDDIHLAWFIKETIDDVDTSDETTFRRWLATMVGNGEPIEWEDLL